MIILKNKFASGRCKWRLRICLILFSGSEECEAFQVAGENNEKRQHRHLGSPLDSQYAKNF